MRRWRVPAAGFVAGVLLVAVYIVGFHGPRSDEITALVADADQLRSQQEPLRREISGLEEVASRETEFTNALRLLERLIPSGLAQAALLLQLQTAADRAGVKLVSITFGDPQVPKSAPESPVGGTVLVAMPLTVVVEGPYVNITDLLRRVEVDLGRAVLVGELALTEAESRFPQLAATWSGQAYALLPADDPLVRDAEVSDADRAPARETP
ncbi:MAG: type 4a pilus biogenesis protein PilO [Actinomycetota bacterium]|nr:type 4a pilus biogenesis protein PilO [Actinomycetota bacterium]